MCMPYHWNQMTEKYLSIWKESSSKISWQWTATTIWVRQLSLQLKSGFTQAQLFLFRSTRLLTFIEILQKLQNHTDKTNINRLEIR